MLQNIGIGKATKWHVLVRREWAQTQENKNLFHINECNDVNFVALAKFKFKNSIVKFLVAWRNQLTWLHSPLYIYSYVKA